jgi:hypothetical protein
MRSGLQLDARSAAVMAMFAWSAAHVQLVAACMTKRMPAVATLVQYQDLVTQGASMHVHRS